MATCTYSPDAETYDGPIHVTFEDIPPVRLESIQAKQGLSRVERLVLASKPRLFSLHEDWCVRLDKVTYEPRLNGSIVIPRKDKDGRTILFDGASVPLPWLISLLTLGVLRPLGVMLTASMIHDYAYKFGHLVKDDGTVVEIERDVADRLFRDLIASVNNMPLAADIAWLAVRWGWPFVRYNNKPRGGRAPVAEYLILVVAIILILTLGAGVNIAGLISTVAGIYAVLYFFTVWLDRKNLVTDRRGTTT